MKTYPKIRRLATCISISELRTLIADMDEILYACQKCENKGLLKYEYTDEHEILAECIFSFLKKNMETMQSLQLIKAK